MKHIGAQAQDSGAGHIMNALDGSANQQFIVETDAIDKLTFHTVTSGTLAGTWKVYVSNSWQAGSPSAQDETLALVAGNWVEITAECIGIVNPAGAASVGMIDVSREDTHGRCPTVGALAVRLTWTKTSGAGNLDVWMMGRGYTD